MVNLQNLLYFRSWLAREKAVDSEMSSFSLRSRTCCLASTSWERSSLFCSQMSICALCLDREQRDPAMLAAVAGEAQPGTGEKKPKHTVGEQQIKSNRFHQD